MRHLRQAALNHPPPNYALHTAKTERDEGEADVAP